MYLNECIFISIKSIWFGMCVFITRFEPTAIPGIDGSVLLWGRLDEFLFMTDWSTARYLQDNCYCTVINQVNIWITITIFSILNFMTAIEHLWQYSKRNTFRETAMHTKVALNFYLYCSGCSALTLCPKVVRYKNDLSGINESSNYAVGHIAATIKKIC